jgi:hypothetical protein
LLRHIARRADRGLQHDISAVGQGGGQAAAARGSSMLDAPVSGGTAAPLRQRSLSSSEVMRRP